MNLEYNQKLVKINKNSKGDKKEEKMRLENLMLGGVARVIETGEKIKRVAPAGMFATKLAEAGGRMFPSGMVLVCDEDGEVDFLDNNTEVTL